MAKRFYVKNDIDVSNKGDKLYIKEGSTVTGVKSMASGNDIKDVKRLVGDYKKSNEEPTSISEWHKVRGTAIVTDGVTTNKAEVHWYQCKDVGKVEFKLKRWY